MASTGSTSSISSASSNVHIVAPNHPEGSTTKHKSKKRKHRSDEPREHVGSRLGEWSTSLVETPHTASHNQGTSSEPKRKKHKKDRHVSSSVAQGLAAADGATLTSTSSIDASAATINDMQLDQTAITEKKKKKKKRVPADDPQVASSAPAPDPTPSTSTTVQPESSTIHDRPHKKKRKRAQSDLDGLTTSTTSPSLPSAPSTVLEPQTASSSDPTSPSLELSKHKKKRKKSKHHPVDSQPHLPSNALSEPSDADAGSPLEPHVVVDATHLSKKEKKRQKRKEKEMQRALLTDGAMPDVSPAIEAPTQQHSPSAFRPLTLEPPPPLSSPSRPERPSSSAVKPDGGVTSDDDVQERKRKKDKKRRKEEKRMKKKMDQTTETSTLPTMTSTSSTSVPQLSQLSSSTPTIVPIISAATPPESTDVQHKDKSNKKKRPNKSKIRNDTNDGDEDHSAVTPALPQAVSAEASAPNTISTSSADMSISTASSTSTVNAPIIASTTPITASRPPPTLNATRVRPPTSFQLSRNKAPSRPRRPSNNEIDSSEPESESETNSDSDSNATPAPAKSKSNPQPQSRPSTSRSQPSPVMDFDDPDELIRASASSRRTHRTTTTSNSTSGDTQDDDATADVDADAETSAAGAKKKPPRAPRKKKVVVASASARDDTIGASGSGDGSDLLWSKWLSAAELKKLREEQGVVMKEGKFSKAESDTVHDAMTRYATEQGLDWDRLKELVNAKRGSKGALEESFWPDIARQLPGRSLLSVYQFVKRKYNPLRSQGPWTIEEDVLLRSAVLNYGTLWQQVGAQVGRTAEDCRDRYRNHVAYGDGRVKGDWTEVEEQKLVGIILDLAKAKGEDLATITGDVDIPWVVVSERMGGVRTRQQCRIKWQEYLSKRKFMWETVQKNHATQSLGKGNSASGQQQQREGPHEGEQSQLASRKAKLKPRRWSAAERKKLIEKLTSSPAQHESEIQWKVIVSQAGWNGVWSAQDLQKRWITLKRSVLGWETLSFRDVVRELATRPFEIQKGAVLSKPTIDTDDEVDTNDGDDD